MKKHSALDILLKEDLSLTKEKANALFACKNVYINDELCSNPKALFPENSKVSLVYSKYVSRGGLKLEKALSVFDFSVKGKVILDAGSSTGGFTDCLLQSGASAVHCVDVGYNLLDYKLRTDSRVYLHERTNIMSVESLSPEADLAVADLSFRSIKGAGAHILNLTKEKCLVALIKPQFELQKGEEGFDGVIRDNFLFEKALCLVFKALEEDGLCIKNACLSPITGHKGNREVLVQVVPYCREGILLRTFLERAGLFCQT